MKDLFKNLLFSALLCCATPTAYAQTACSANASYSVNNFAVSFNANTGTLTYAFIPIKNNTSLPHASAERPQIATFGVSFSATTGYYCNESNMNYTGAVTGGTLVYNQGRSITTTSGQVYSSSITGLCNLAPGTYKVCVRVAGGGTNGHSPYVQTTFTVPALSATASVNNASCGQNNGSITISASNACSFQYSLNNGAWQSSINTFSNLAAGSYTWRVRNANAPTVTVSGNSIVGNNNTVLSAPTGVSATQGNCGSVTLYWNAVSGATGYPLFRGNTFLGTVPAGTTSFVDNNAPSTPTTYNVHAENACGYSAAASATGYQTAAPPCAAPTGLSASTSATAATVSWASVANASSYTLFYRVGSSGAYTSVSVASTSRVLTGLASATSYQYYIMANCACSINSVASTIASFSTQSGVSNCTFTAATTTGGTASGSATVVCGNTVTAVATPNAGYTFLNWRNGATVVSSSATYPFALTTNTTLTAYFTPTPPSTTFGNYPRRRFPVNTSRALARYIRFQWDAVHAPANATVTYTIEILDANNNAVQVLTGLTGTEYTLTSPLLHETTYQWRVRAVVNGIPSAWTSFASFQTMRDMGSACGAVMDKLRNSAVLRNHSSNCASTPNCSGRTGSSFWGIDTGVMWQCVEFANRFFWTEFVMNLRRAFSCHAEDFPAQSPAAGFKVYSNGSTIPPAAGDLITWAGRHIAVVKYLTPTHVVFTQQNARCETVDSITYSLSRGAYYLADYVGQTQAWMRITPKVSLSNLTSGVCSNSRPTLYIETNTNVYTAHDVYLIEYDANYQETVTHLTAAGRIANTPSVGNLRYQMPSLTRGKHYAIRVVTHHPVGAADSDLLRFQVAANATRSTTSSSGIENVLFRSTNAASGQAVSNARLFHYSTTQEAYNEIGFTSSQGLLNAIGLFPEVEVGDSIIGEAAGFQDAAIVVSQSMINAAEIIVSFGIDPNSSAVMQAQVNRITNGQIDNSPIVHDSAITIRCTAINHNGFAISIPNEDDQNAAGRVYYPATDSLQNYNLQLGANTIVVRFFNANDTVISTLQLQYVPLDSLSTQAYPVLVLGDAANAGANMYINGSFTKTLSSQNELMQMPVSSNNTFFFTKSGGFSPISVTTNRADTIVLNWVIFSIQNNAPSTEAEAKLFPNPATQKAYYQYYSEHEGQAFMTLHNHLGQAVREWSHQAVQAGAQQVELDLSGLPSGAYWLEVRAQAGARSVWQLVVTE